MRRYKQEKHKRDPESAKHSKSTHVIAASKLAASTSASSSPATLVTTAAAAIATAKPSPSSSSSITATIFSAPTVTASSSPVTMASKDESPLTSSVNTLSKQGQKRSHSPDSSGAGGILSSRSKLSNSQLQQEVSEKSSSSNYEDDRGSGKSSSSTAQQQTQQPFTGTSFEEERNEGIGAFPNSENSEFADDPDEVVPSPNGTEICNIQIQNQPGSDIDASCSTASAGSAEGTRTTQSTEKMIPNKTRTVKSNLSVALNPEPSIIMPSKHPDGNKSNRTRQLDRSLTKMVCSTLLPFNIVEHDGFRQFVKCLDEHYNLPSQNTVSGHLLNELYKEVQQKISTSIYTTHGFMSLSIDGQALVTIHFISEDFKKHNYHTLKIIDYGNPHTAENLKTVIQTNIIDKFTGLKCFSAVTDCAANMIATTAKLSLQHIPCIAHRLHSVVTAAILRSKMEEPTPPSTSTSNPTSTNNQNENKTKHDDKTKKEGLGSKLEFKDNENVKMLSNLEVHELDQLIVAYDEEVEVVTVFEENNVAAATVETNQNIPEKKEPISVASIIRKIKVITKAFNQSSTLAEALKKEAISRKLNFTLLTQECPTRWNSTFSMIKRFQDTIDCVTVVLEKVGRKFKNLELAERNVLPDIIASLECFSTATNDLSGQMYVSISLIIPTVTVLMRELEECTNEKCKTKIGKAFAQDLWNFANLKLSVYETITCSALATVLDPRFKCKGFRNRANFTQAIQRLQNEIELMIEKKKRIQKEKVAKTPTPPPQTEGANSTNANTKPKGLSKLFAETDVTGQQSRKIIEELTRAYITVLEYAYNGQPQSELKLNEDPLEYWRNSPSRYLKDLARKYLCIPATSVPSEVTFSTTGDVVTPLLSLISPDKENKLVFVNKNMSKDFLMTND